MTRAQVVGGPVVLDPGLADGADVVACTATSPSSGRSFVQGFFTPRG
ncbi:MAG: hypothetical protein M3P93_01055 [Actinomycetota bacterium]|nr:hypothetical protein [Actinomycetota bacterium]